jgi:hypothetical protein
MGTDDDGVLAAARAIRPYLTELVGPDDAAELDRRIAELLNDATDPPGNVGRLRMLLDERSETTGWFLSEVLADAPQYRPPYHQPRYLRHRGMPSPAGVSTTPIPAPRYTCPEGGDYVWYRPEVGTAIPDCPTHHVRLTRT